MVREAAMIERLYTSCIEPLARWTQSGTSGFALARTDWQPSMPNTGKRPRRNPNESERRMIRALAA
jgi:hypothetical protein